MKIYKHSSKWHIVYGVYNVYGPDLKQVVICAVLSILGRTFSPKFFRRLALVYLWAQMLSVLAYSVIQHPLVKPFFTR